MTEHDSENVQDLNEVIKSVEFIDNEIPVPAEEDEPKVIDGNVELKPGTFIKPASGLPIDLFNVQKVVPGQPNFYLITERIRDLEMTDPEALKMIQDDLKEVFAGGVKLAHEMTPEQRIERINLLQSLVIRIRTEVQGIRAKHDLDLRDLSIEERARLRELDKKYDKARKPTAEGISGTKVRVAGKKRESKSPVEKQVLMLHKLGFDGPGIVQQMATMLNVQTDIEAVNAIIEGK